MKYNYGGENYKIIIMDFNFLYVFCIIWIRCYYGRRIFVVWCLWKGYELGKLKFI